MVASSPKPIEKIRHDVVGSLLRPAYLKDARLRFEEGEMGADELRKIEDGAIRDAVLLQEKTGLEIVTDGEFRRLNFEESFGASVSGLGSSEENTRYYEQRAKQARPLERAAIPALVRTIADKLHLVRNLPLEEFRFTSQATARPVKVTLMSADYYRQRFGPGAAVSAYEAVEDFMADVVRIQREIVTGLLEAGCPYVQIDGPRYAAFVDPREIEMVLQKARDPMAELRLSIQADNEVIRGLSGATFAMHVCRGNRNSMWIREGGYDPIAEALFNELDHSRFLLEYDSPRAGSFEPLRFVPKSKTVVLGLVSTKTPELEKTDDLKRRIEEASRYAPLERLALSPQCGFSTNVGGNLITEDDQKRKLELVVETARQVWG